MVTVKRCPCCKQIIKDPADPPKPARICYDCGNPILRGHRFTYQERRGETAIVHRVCSNPESYYRTAECRRIGVVGYRGMTDQQVAEATAREDELEARFAAWRKEQGK